MIFIHVLIGGTEISDFSEDLLQLWLTDTAYSVANVPRQNISTLIETKHDARWALADSPVPAIVWAQLWTTSRISPVVMKDLAEQVQHVIAETLEVELKTPVRVDVHLGTSGLDHASEQRHVTSPMATGERLTVDVQSSSDKPEGEPAHEDPSTLSVV